MVFAEHLACWRVHHRRARHEDPRGDSSLAQPFEHVEGAADVDGKRRFDLVPRPSDVRRAGAVIDRGRAYALERCPDGGPVEQFDCFPADARDRAGLESARDLARLDDVPDRALLDRAHDRALLDSAPDLARLHDGY